MKKITPLYSVLHLTVLVALLLLSSQSAFARLTIEITEGSQGALPIGIVPFALNQQAVPAGQSLTNPADVIRADLSRSGVFNPLNIEKLPQQPSQGSDVDFKAWQSISIENLVVGQINPLPSGQFEVRFQLFDTYAKKQLLGYRFEVAPQNIRRVSHQISDLVYKKLTGHPGAFDSLIAYVQVATQVVNSKVEREYTLAVADSDGFNEQIILKSNDPILSPAWSAKGNQIAYVSFEEGRSVVYVQELRSGKRRQVAAFKGLNSAPSWSPDGKRLALTLSRDGNSEIYILFVDSGVLQRVTNHYAIDTEATWMPDGQSLMFTSDRGGRPQVYQVPINVRGKAGKVKRVTFEGKYNARPVISPDGKYLAMVHGDQGKYRIAVMELETRYLQVLTQSRLDESPSFSPNSRMIIYATEIKGQGVLEAVAVDGVNSPQRLQIKGRDVREPAWSPLRQ